MKSLAAVLLLSLGQSTTDARPPHPLAPSLPQLTKEETARYEKVVERFILYDIGKLPGAAGKKALEDFNNLPPEAIFVLVDGFNRAAAMEASCPAVIIGKKISSIANRSEDLQLLAFLKENLGAGVTAKRHQGLLKDIQFGLLLRRATVQKKLALAGNQATAAFPEKSLEKLSGPALAKQLAAAPPTTLKKLLASDRSEVKAAAAKEIGRRRLRYVPDLITLLEEHDPAVQQAARSALVQIAGVDFGPSPDGSVTERTAAIERWRSWWARSSKK